MRRHTRDIGARSDGPAGFALNPPVAPEVRQLPHSGRVAALGDASRRPVRRCGFAGYGDTGGGPDARSSTPNKASIARSSSPSPGTSSSPSG